MVFFFKPGTVHGYADIEGLVLYDVLIGEKAFTGHLHDLREVSGFRKSSCKRTETSPCSSERAPTLRNPLAGRCHQERVGEAGLRQRSRCYGVCKVAPTDDPHQPLLHLTQRNRLPGRSQTAVHHLLYGETSRPQHLARRACVHLQYECEYAQSPVQALHRLVAGGFSQPPPNRLCLNAALTTNLSIERISEKTGFSDASYFARQSRSHMQMSPSQYTTLWTTPTAD